MEIKHKNSVKIKSEGIELDDFVIDEPKLINYSSSEKYNRIALSQNEKSDIGWYIQSMLEAQKGNEVDSLDALAKSLKFNNKIIAKNEPVFQRFKENKRFKKLVNYS